MRDDTSHEQLGQAVAADEDRSRQRLTLILSARAVDDDPPEELINTAWVTLSGHLTRGARMEADARAALEVAWWAGYLREQPTRRVPGLFSPPIPGLDWVADHVLAGLLAESDPLEVLQRAGLNRGRP
jgi:hypothetical protein